MIDLPLPRWAARIVLLFYVWGFVTGTLIMAALIWQAVVQWLREKGGW